MVRKRTLLAPGSSEIVEIPISEAQCCDVVFVNNDDETVHIIREEKYWPNSGYTPIGIVVIPTSHGVLKNGDGVGSQCGVMSLCNMATNTPTTGGLATTSKFGGGSTNVTGKSDGLSRYDSTTNGLIGYNSTVKTATSSSNVADGLVVGSGYSYSTSYIPYQASISSTPVRTKSPYAPSPYVGSDYKSGGYNDSYGTTSFDTASNMNCLQDFSSIVNTFIVAYHMATGQSDWKTASTITDNWGSGYYPAVCCCCRFNPIGTVPMSMWISLCESGYLGHVNQAKAALKTGVGFWYMPSIGEVGYIAPKTADINSILNKIASKYTDVMCSQLSTGTYAGYVSSTKHTTGRWFAMQFNVYNNANQTYIRTIPGSYSHYDELMYSNARAFMRLQDGVNIPKPVVW